MEAMMLRAAQPPDTSVVMTIDEATQVGAARRAAVALGHTHVLSVAAIGRLAIVTTEAATNILRHAGHGVIVLRGMMLNGNPAIEVTALDQGPGIPDVDRAMRDGYSTVGT